MMFILIQYNRVEIQKQVLGFFFFATHYRLVFITESLWKFTVHHLLQKCEMIRTFKCCNGRVRFFLEGEVAHMEMFCSSGQRFVTLNRRTVRKVLSSYRAKHVTLNCLDIQQVWIRFRFICDSLWIKVSVVSSTIFTIMGQ